MHYYYCWCDKNAMEITCPLLLSRTTFYICRIGYSINSIALQLEGEGEGSGGKQRVAPLREADHHQ